MWIVLLTTGYDIPEAFGPFEQHEDALRFAQEHEDAGAEVSWIFPAEEVNEVVRP